MSRPTPDELAEAIEEFLSGEILPTLDDHRLRFRMLVALNALGIVRRELAALPAGGRRRARELAARIRAGDVPPGTLARVKADVAARLQIDSPRYLDRYDRNSLRLSGPMNHVGEVPDHTLWRRAAAGDGDAFGLLFERHASRIYNYCFRRTGDWARAEDLTSATFLVAWKTCQPRPVAGGERAAVAVRHRDERPPEPTPLAEARPRGVRAAAPSPHSRSRTSPTTRRNVSTTAARLQALLAVFAQLPRREQDVIALCDWSDLSYDDAAAALGIPIGTVRSRLARGRGTLAGTRRSPTDPNGTSRSSRYPSR